MDRFRWVKNGRHYDPSAVEGARVATQADKGTIIISRPNESDEGLYQCIVENPHGRAVSNKIYLRYASKFASTSLKQSVNHEHVEVNIVTWDVMF